MSRIVPTLIHKNKVDARYVTLFPHLTTLAPEIVAAILDETLPADVTLADLCINPAVGWEDGRSYLAHPFRRISLPR